MTDYEIDLADISRDMQQSLRVDPYDPSEVSAYLGLQLQFAIAERLEELVEVLRDMADGRANSA